MKIDHSDNVESSHVGHIAFVVLAFLIGAIVGYAVGTDWENAKFTEDQAATTVTIPKKVMVVASPTAVVVP